MDQKRLDPQSQAAKDLASGRYIIRKMNVADIDAVAINCNIHRCGGGGDA